MARVVFSHQQTTLNQVLLPEFHRSVRAFIGPHALFSPTGLSTSPPAAPKVKARKVNPESGRTRDRTDIPQVGGGD